MITKKIFNGELQVDTEEGKIWMNTTNCLLRIQNIRFNKIEEKFTLIDINGIDAFMYPGKIENDEYEEFIQKISLSILPKIFNLDIEKRKEMLNNLYLKINEELKA